MRLPIQISIIAAILTSVIFLCSAELPSDLPPVQEGTYYLKSRNSGKVITVKNSSQAKGAILLQSDFSRQTNQQFELTSAGGGFYFIKAKHSGKYATVKGGSMENQAPVWQANYSGKAHQQFRLESAGGRFYYIKARHSGKCLSVKSNKNGAPLFQFACKGQSQQQFELIAVSSGNPTASRTPKRTTTVPTTRRPNSNPAPSTNASAPQPQATTTTRTEYTSARVGNTIGCNGNSFLDPIDGGTCWTCPDGYKRTIFSVKSDKACERAAFEDFKKATPHNRGTGLLGTDCPGGQFFDPNGYCYSCPTGYNRTAFPVTSSKACSKRVHADYRSANYVKSARECGNGYFFDQATLKCWTCPSGYKRSGYALGSGKACERTVRVRN